MIQLSKVTQAVGQLADDDLVALAFDSYVASSSDTSSSNEGDSSNPSTLRLCVIRNQEFVYPLIRNEDDVDIGLFWDPRHLESTIRLSDIVMTMMSSTDDTT